MTYGTPETPTSFSIHAKQNANKFEPGSKSMVEIIAMSETLKLFSAVGMETIGAEARRLAGLLRDGLRNDGMSIFNPQEGAIINFSAGTMEKNLKISSALKKAKISYALRGPGIRLSVHAFNLDFEINAALNVINGATK